MQSIRIYSLLAVVLGVTACATPDRVQMHTASHFDGESVLFVGDPQIHNVYAAHLKQMSWIAKLGARVAVRPPELNILAPYSLSHLIETGAPERSGTAPSLVILGDGTNIACSGEFDVFKKTVDDSLGRGAIWLMAHGNHDTFLMGTNNAYIEYREDLEDVEWVPPELMADESTMLPPDESIWRDIQRPGSRANWRDACYMPGAVGDSTPMNKISWLAKYLDHLNDLHVELNVTVDEKDRHARVLESVPVTEGPLRGLDFRVLGRWYQPGKKGPDPIYESFIVQAIDVGDSHRLILIDTSACDAADPSDFNYVKKNAGSWGCIGLKQLGAIREAIKTDRHVVVAGHFPLEDIDRHNRADLIRIMSEHGKWIYISAHSHKPLGSYNWGDGVEYNIGSTTDWPMEAHQFSFATASSDVAPLRSFRYSEVKLPAYTNDYDDYKKPRHELCRHLAAAEELAKLDDSMDVVHWKSPPPSAECILKLEAGGEDVWNEHGGRLRDALAKIRENYDDRRNRRVIREIAAAAAKELNGQYGIADFLEVYVP